MVRRQASENRSSMRLGGRRFRRTLPTLLTLSLLLWPFVVSSTSSSPIFTDRANVFARAYVKPLAVINQEKAFAFPDAVPGADAVRIHPSDTRAVSFTFSGEKRRTYFLQFPQSLEISLTGDGKKHPDRTVRISDLSCSQRSAGVLPSDGSMARASLGATRDSLRTTQHSGIYSGALPVTVVYP